MLLQTAFDGQIYTTSIMCDDHYPDAPPTIRFITRVNLTCVNPNNGLVCHACMHLLHTLN